MSQVTGNIIIGAFEKDCSLQFYECNLVLSWHVASLGGNKKKENYFHCAN